MFFFYLYDILIIERRIIMKKIIIVLLITISITFNNVQAEQISNNYNDNNVIVEVKKTPDNKEKAKMILIYTGGIVILGITSFTIVLIKTKKASS